jgi:predicted DNA binding CopG/RHH family protein
MSKPIRYSDEPLGEFRVVPDFLPSASELALREEYVNVTISLSKDSIEYFKEEASKHQTPYQKIMRKLLDAYVYQQRARASRSV